MQSCSQPTKGFHCLTDNLYMLFFFFMYCPLQEDAVEAVDRFRESPQSHPSPYIISNINAHRMQNVIARTSPSGIRTACRNSKGSEHEFSPSIPAAGQVRSHECDHICLWKEPGCEAMSRYPVRKPDRRTPGL